MINKSFPTIHDVANHLGLSISTVSFVINGRADQQRISARTIQRVNNYIKEIGYVPDRCAQSFRTKRTGIIGLLVEDLSDRTTAVFAKQLEQIAFHDGFKMIIQQLSGTDKVNKVIESLHDNQIEAYLVMVNDRISLAVLNKIKSVPMPIIFFSLGLTKTYYPDMNPIRMTQIDVAGVRQLFKELKGRLQKNGCIGVYKKSNTGI